ncbi:hypothetical protein [Clostridium tarantellae]|nr:hypothetical protein [Clostridium tarantellae]
MFFASFFGFIMIALNTFFLALGIYALVLFIKALKIYINKNS